MSQEILRIVRLTFHPENVDAFIDIFSESKDLIGAFDGCIEVKLKKDQELQNVYYTVSKWKSNDHLNTYRKSELFEKTWAKTKKLFSDKPKAFSLIDAN
jgi:heme oxygenase (mycobilin-producing)